MAGTASDDSTDAQIDRAKRFGRDVGINIIANLFAAAIIYLVGALVGILPRNTLAIMTSITYIVVSTTIAAQIYGMFSVFQTGKINPRYFSIAFYLFSASLAMIPFTSRADWPTRRNMAIVCWIFALLVAGFTFMMTRELSRRNAQMTKTEKSADEVAGLSTNAARIPE